jgi:hypothetical protein
MRVTGWLLKGCGGVNGTSMRPGSRWIGKITWRRVMMEITHQKPTIPNVNPYPSQQGNGGGLAMSYVASSGV